MITFEEILRPGQTFYYIDVHHTVPGPYKPCIRMYQILKCRYVPERDYKLQRDLMFFDKEAAEKEMRRRCKKDAEYYKKHFK